MPRRGRIVSDLCQLSDSDWASLDHQANPFLSLGLLQAFEQSGSVTAETGWQPHHLALYEEDRLVAFAPAYLKSHSHGEFVFDWSWADAYHRHGHQYYPKLLTAIPYSPIQGPRFMVDCCHPDPAELRQELLALAIEETEKLGCSGWHCNFTRPEDDAILGNAAVQGNLLARFDWQFHWHNEGFDTFDQFLGTLRSKKRKNMRRDRRLVVDAGIRFRRLSGDQVTPDELEFIFDCYRITFLRYGNHPALNHEFFRLMLETMPESVMVVIASKEQRDIAMSFFLQGGGTLYGRYWGCLEEVPGLHFETAYHQGIEHCIEHGLQTFEPGAQGEHKIYRGFSPVQTRSYHFIRHPEFRRAIARYLQQEADWIREYGQRLDAHLPFRKVKLP